MKNLILNVGSSSVKYCVFDGENSILEGIVENTTTDEGYYNAVAKIFRQLNEKSIKIDAIGHRVVHGKDITKPRIITDSLMQYLKKYQSLRRFIIRLS